MRLVFENTKETETEALLADTLSCFEGNQCAFLQTQVGNFCYFNHLLAANLYIDNTHFVLRNFFPITLICCKPQAPGEVSWGHWMQLDLWRGQGKQAACGSIQSQPVLVWMALTHLVGECLKVAVPKAQGTHWLWDFVDHKSCPGFYSFSLTLMLNPCSFTFWES